MKNYQIFNAYQSFEKLMSLNYSDYDINVDLALMYMELEKRYNIITAMIHKLYGEFYAVEQGQYVIDITGNYVLKPDKSQTDLNKELDKISNADANYEPTKITIYRDTLRDNLISPKDIVLLKDFIVFSKDTKSNYTGGEN